MMNTIGLRGLVPCLWFDSQAEEAAELYTAVFPNSRIVSVTRFGKEGFEIHGRPEGSVMSVDFEINGHPFQALNGGPMFKFTEAVSFQVLCDTQEGIDYYWERLTEGGDPSAQQCGWLKDKFGVSWQVVPAMLSEWITGPDARSQRVMAVMLQMEKKLDIRQLREAYEGLSQAG